MTIWDIGIIKQCHVNRRCKSYLIFVPKGVKLIMNMIDRANDMILEFIYTSAY